MGLTAVVGPVGSGHRSTGRSEDPAANRTVRAAVLAYAVASMATSAYVASLLLRRPGEFWPYFDLNVKLAIEVGAALLCLIGAARRGPGRVPGLLLGSALLLWSVGDLLFSVASPEGAPVPSLADGFFLAFYPLAYAAIVIVVRAEARSLPTASWADGLLTALGCATVVVTLGLDGVLKPGEGSAAAVGVTLAYPIGDLALLSMVVGVFGVIPHRQFRRHLPWLLVLGGSALFAVSDTLFLVASAADTYQQGTLVDAGWTMAMVLMSASTWVRSPTPRSDGQPGKGHVLLAVCAAVVGFGVLLYGTERDLDRIDVILAAATLATAAARVMTLLRELDGLEAERRLRRHAEASARRLALQEAENRALATRLAGLVEAAPVGIVEIDAAGRVCRWNRAAERIYGWSETELLGRPDPNPVTATGPGQTVRHLRQDGTSVEVELAVAGLADPERPDGTLKVVTDVSERIGLELQLRHSQKLETVGRLAEGLAHELNTPIQIVGDVVRFLGVAMAGLGRLHETASELAGGQAPGPGPGPAPAQEQLQRLRTVMDEIDLEFLAQEGTEAAGNALDGLRRMAEIVRAMTIFGRPGETLQRAVDLNEAVRAVLVMFGPRIAEVADVTTELGELPMVVCHPGDVNQVLFDVVANAVDAMAALAAQRGRGRLGIVTRAAGDQVVIEVSDTGCGIPDPIAERIFDPFFTTKQVGQGRGQGLSVARSLIVGRHQGSLTFSTSPGQGTTFRIALPCTRCVPTAP